MMVHLPFKGNLYLAFPARALIKLPTYLPADSVAVYISLLTQSC